MPRHEQKRKPLWRRPRRGRKSANANQWHSCGHSSVKGHLRGWSAGDRAIYERFVSAVEACGPVTLSPVKTRIGFWTTHGFSRLSRLRLATMFTIFASARRKRSTTQ